MKSKTKNTVEKKNLIVVICITVILSIGIPSYFIYHKEEIKQQEENKRLEKEIKEKNYYRKKLTDCINEADSNRSNLWSANCPDNNSNCKLDSSIVEWIDSRYKQDIEDCKIQWDY